MGAERDRVAGFGRLEDGLLQAGEWIANGDIEKALGEVTLENLWEPGNATHGFLDFMLMMGAAGAGEKADYADTLDLFHTMEAYFTWYPQGGNA